MVMMGKSVGRGRQGRLKSSHRKDIGDGENEREAWMEGGNERKQDIGWKTRGEKGRKDR